MIDFTIQPFSFLSFEDLIGKTFNSPNTFGALTSICLNDQQPLIFSRTYNQTEDGTYGQGIRAPPYDQTFYQGEKAFLFGLKNTSDFRTNVGFLNLEDIPIELQFQLYDEDGIEIASSSYTLPALSHLQINNIFSSLSIFKEYNSAWAKVWTDTRGGRFTAYSSIVDNTTGDPVYLEAKPFGGYTPEDFHLVIPVLASVPGAYRTNWKTEVVFTNSSIEENEIKLKYHPATREKPIIESFTLEPGKVKYYFDFLYDVFGIEKSFGWLEVDFSSAGLLLRARIYTGESGTYGQGIQAEKKKELYLSTSPIYLLNLIENGDYRTNLGILNLSDEEGTFTLELIKDSLVLTQKTISIPAKTLKQLNSVLSSIFEVLGDGFTLKISALEGAICTAYLSTVDNKTGDAVFQLFSFESH